MIPITKIFHRTHTDNTLSLFVQFLLKPCVPCAPPPPLLPCYSLDYRGWQLLDQPFLVYVFSSFHPNLFRFPHGVYSSCAVSYASSPLFCPPRSYPHSRSRSHPRPRSYLRYCSRFRPLCRPRSRSHPVFVSGSPPPSPFPFPSPPRPRSRSLSHLALLRSPPPLFPSLFPPSTPIPPPSVCVCA